MTKEEFLIEMVNLINKFYEEKCQLVKNAGDNQLVIVNFIDIEGLLEEVVRIRYEKQRNKI